MLNILNSLLLFLPFSFCLPLRFLFVLVPTRVGGLICLRAGVKSADDPLKNPAAEVVHEVGREGAQHQSGTETPHGVGELTQGYDCEHI